MRVYRYLLICVLQLILWGCDAKLSQFDKIKVEFDGVSQSPPELIVQVNVGGDLVTNQEVFVDAVTVNAKTFAWEMISGPGTIYFSSSTKEDTNIRADADGIYIIRLVAIGSDGTQAYDDLNFTWDTVVPTVNVGADVITNGVFTLNPVVSGANTYLWTTVSGAVQFSDASAAQTQGSASNGVHVVRLTASDAAGNTASDDLQITWDDLPPSNLDNFAALTGPSLGTTELQLTFPATVSDYASVEIRRMPGITPPAASCDSGDVVATLTTFSPGMLSITDDVGSAGEDFSYRLCIYDSLQNLNAAMTAASVQSKPHIAFLSSATFDGNMGGLGGADGQCLTLASSQASLQDEAKWRSVLSISAIDVKQRIGIYGVVEDVLGNTILPFGNDMWGGSLNFPIRIDEAGNNLGSVIVWTGSDASGLRVASSHCGSWSSNSAVGSGNRGDSGAVNGSWLDIGTNTTCDQFYRIYCVSQYDVAVLDAFTAVTGADAAGDIEMTLDFPADTSKYDRVELRRIAGVAAPAADCSDGTVVTTFNPPFSDMSYTDATGSPGSAFSYRTCLYELAGNLVASQSQVNILAKP